MHSMPPSLSVLTWEMGDSQDELLRMELLVLRLVHNKYIDTFSLGLHSLSGATSPRIWETSEFSITSSSRAKLSPGLGAVLMGSPTALYLWAVLLPDASEQRGKGLAPDQVGQDRRLGLGQQE